MWGQGGRGVVGMWWGQGEEEVYVWCGSYGVGWGAEGVAGWQVVHVWNKKSVWTW